MPEVPTRLARLGVPVAVVGALLLAVAARLHNAGAKPLWNDEAFSLRIAMQPLADVVASIAQDVHPPLYYALLHGWLALVPGDATGRHLSVLAGCAALGVAWLFARRVVSPLQAASAAALCAILPLHVSWSQISRGYALLLLCSMLALHAAAEVLRLLDAPPGRRDGRRLVGYGALYAVAAAGALWTHNIAVFLLLGINAAAGWRLLTRQLHGIGAVLGWSLCQLGAALFWAPWLPSLLVQSGRLGWQHFAVSFPGMLERALGLFGGFMLWKLGLLAGGIGLAAALLGATRLHRRNAHAQVAVAATVVPILACVLLFLAGKPAFGYSILNLIWIPALLAVLISANLRWPAAGDRLRPLLGAALALAFVLVNARGLSNWYATPNPDWNAVAARLAGAAAPGDAIVAQTALTPDAAAGARGEVPLHALHLRWEGLRRADPGLPVPGLPPSGDDAALHAWMMAQPRLWVPVSVPMPEETLAMRVVALAERQPEAWRVTREAIGRLGLARIERVGR